MTTQEDPMPDATPVVPAVPDMPAVPDTPAVPAVVPPGLPTVLASPGDATAPRSDYSRQRGSTAAVDSSMPAVATQDKTNQDRRRGASHGPGRKKRSRSPVDRGTRREGDWEDMIQLTQSQLARLTA